MAKKTKKKTSGKTVAKKKSKTKLHNNAINLADQDYYKKLPPEIRKVWYDQFNAEYYSNDHSKKGSLFRSILGEKYFKELTDRTFYWDKKMTIKQALYNDTNARNRCMYSILDVTKFRQSKNSLNTNAFYEKKDEISDRTDVVSRMTERQEEGYEVNINDVVEELLKSNTPKEAIEHLKVMAKTAIQNEPEFIEEHINNLVDASMILALRATRKLK